MQRRAFLQTAVAAGTGLLAAGAADGEAGRPRDTVSVALIGAGEQGRVLMDAALLIPGVRFQAICDIWKYRRRAAMYYLETYHQQANEYQDYREMLNQEKGLQAVLVATPDFAHAEQANACLEAGLHVYCEKMMSNRLETARAMVRTARRTGKLLQIGYQRRSNPRYLHVYMKLLGQAKLAGRLTQAQLQWGHGVRDDLGWPKKQALSRDLLKQYGYANMHEFRNWRFFKKYGTGPLGDFGAQQLDVCRWFLGCPPRAVLASAGIDYYPHRQWYDNVMSVLEYGAAEGTVRASSNIFTTTSGGPMAYYEQFMGSEGTIRISERAAWTKLFREAYAPDWDPWTRQELLVKESTAAEDKKPPTGGGPEDPNEVHVRETGQVTAYRLPTLVDKPAHQPHLENFFDAVRGKAALNCPAEAAFASEVVVYKLNEAIDCGRRIELKAEDFQA
jgi:predicted dehydrogenase